MKKQQLVIGTCVVLGLSGIVFAQQSEFQAKIQEDMDGYKQQIADNCGAKPAMKFVGKLAVNPRESEKPDYNSVSTLCTSGLDSMSSTCQSNGVVKQAFSKITSVVCTYGKGTLDFKIKGGELTFMLDPSYTKNNAAGQSSDLVAKIKKTLDN